MSVMSEVGRSRFYGVDLVEETLKGRFDQARGAIREKFKVVGIDVEQAVVALQAEIQRWKQGELQRNPVLERQIDHLSSELTRKLYKHALQSQIVKMTRAFRDYREQLDVQGGRVKKTLSEFAGRVEEFRETPARHSRKKCLEFLVNPGWDQKAIEELFDSLSEDTHETLSDGTGLVARLAKGDLSPVAVEKTVYARQIPENLDGAKDLLKAAREADAAFERASIPVEGDKTLDQIALDWMSLSEAAEKGPKIHKEAAERFRQAEARFAKLPRYPFPEELPEMREHLRTAKEILVELEAVQALLAKSAEMYAMMGRFAPYLGWDSVLSNLQKDVEWKFHTIKTYCGRMKQEIEIAEQFVLPPPQAEKPKPPEALPPAALPQPIAEKSAWDRFCDFISGVAAAIHFLFTGCRQPQPD